MTPYSELRSQIAAEAARLHFDVGFSVEAAVVAVRLRSRWWLPLNLQGEVRELRDLANLFRLAGDGAIPDWKPTTADLRERAALAASEKVDPEWLHTNLLAPQRQRFLVLVYAYTLVIEDSELRTRWLVLAAAGFLTAVGGLLVAYSRLSA